MSKILRVVTTISLCLLLAIPSHAQDEEKKPTSGTRRQLATIIFAGLGGAVLGLSTLSFYGRPQDMLSNIAIGFAVGVIAGTVYVTYNTATKPRSSVFQEQHFKDLESVQRDQFLLSQRPMTPTATFRFEF
jgi:drug/metabolite transporter (DMT)-like permease